MTASEMVAELMRQAERETRNAETATTDTARKHWASRAEQSRRYAEALASAAGVRQTRAAA